MRRRMIRKAGIEKEATRGDQVQVSRRSLILDVVPVLAHFQRASFSIPAIHLYGLSLCDRRLSSVFSNGPPPLHVHRSHVTHNIQQRPNRVETALNDLATIYREWRLKRHHRLESHVHHLPFTSLQFIVPAGHVLSILYLVSLQMLSSNESPPVTDCTL